MPNGILQQAKSKFNIIELLRPHLDPRVNIKKNLDVAEKYFIEHKSTTKIAQEYSMSSSRVSDMLQFYRDQIAPLMVRILNERN